MANNNNNRKTMIICVCGTFTYLSSYRSCLNNTSVVAVGFTHTYCYRLLSTFQMFIHRFFHKSSVYLENSKQITLRETPRPKKKKKELKENNLRSHTNIYSCIHSFVHLYKTHVLHIKVRKFARKSVILS